MTQEVAVFYEITLTCATVMSAFVAGMTVVDVVRPSQIIRLKKNGGFSAAVFHLMG
jgi:hypothetical protein